MTEDFHPLITFQRFYPRRVLQTDLKFPFLIQDIAAQCRIGKDSSWPSNTLVEDFQGHSDCLHYSKLVISGPLDQSSDMGMIAQPHVCPALWVHCVGKRFALAKARFDCRIGWKISTDALGVRTLGRS